MVELAWNLILAVRTGEEPEQVSSTLGQATLPHLQANPLIPLDNSLPHTDMAATAIPNPLSLAPVHMF